MHGAWMPRSTHEGGSAVHVSWVQTLHYPHKSCLTTYRGKWILYMTITATIYVIQHAIVICLLEVFLLFFFFLSKKSYCLYFILLSTIMVFLPG